MPNLAVQLLLARQRDDGGWGAYPGHPSRTESTALGALALARALATAPDAALGAALAGAREWLHARQLPSGAWPLGDDVPGPSWATCLAALALSHIETERGAARSAAVWLLDQRGRGSPWWVRLLFRIDPSRRTVELDTDLVGWAWVDGTFSWVEPTAYALLALKRVRADLPVEPTAGRIEQAERLLADRVCSDGGWNYGNTRVFDEALWSYPDTTALALLALADRSEDALVERGLAALDRMIARDGSVLALGLASLALATYGRDAAGPRGRLVEQVEAWPDGETRALAWAALGLLEMDDPLGVRRA